jgi:hypothetical protein
MDVDTCSVMIVITQEETSLASLALCFLYEPIYEIGTVLIMLQAI